MFLTRKFLTTLYFSPLLKRCVSSSLIKLKINVVNILDILCLLDGLLESLSTLIIIVLHIYDEIVVPYSGTRVSMILIFMFREKSSLNKADKSVLFILFYL